MVEIGGKTLVFLNHGCRKPPEFGHKICVAFGGFYANTEEGNHVKFELELCTFKMVTPLKIKQQNQRNVFVPQRKKTF